MSGHGYQSFTDEELGFRADEGLRWQISHPLFERSVNALLLQLCRIADAQLRILEAQFGPAPPIPPEKPETPTT
jgi:hypothetical protein